MKKIIGGFLAVIGAAAIVTVGVEVVKRVNKDKANAVVGEAKLEDIIDPEVLPEGFDEDKAAQKLEEEGVVAPLQGTPYENEDNTPGSEIKTEDPQEGDSNVG